jgi:hypothetical protein
LIKIENQVTEALNNMKTKTIYVIFVILLFAIISIYSSDKKKTTIVPNPYFPVNNGVTLIYKSSFGESISKYFQDGEYIISSSESDDFKYKQTFIIKDEGVYTRETYQYYKVFLFITKESTVTYNNPLLRFPLPLSPGMNWKWEGEEYSDGEISKVKVNGKAFDKEFIKTKAGSFETIKLETIIETSDATKNKVTEWYAEGVGLIKAQIVIDGGGLMGILRDLLGYGTIEFELEEIRKE